MASIKFDAASEEAARNDKLREVFTIMGGNLDFNKFKTTEASLIRPFVSPLAWAFYSAYQTIILHSMMQLQLLKNGVDKDILKTDELRTLLKQPYHIRKSI